MAIMGASFEIGRSALTAYQAAISVVGQNIANVGNSDYARQSAHLAARSTGSTATGVEVNALQRHVDEALEARLRSSLGQRSGAETIHTTLSSIESLYNELSDTDLSTQLSEFFGSFAQLQTDPLEYASRELVISSADAVIRTLQQQRSGLLTEIEDLNSSARDMAETANGLAEQIADLNQRIVTAEGSGTGQSSSLRDQRDACLRELAELVDIQTRQYDNGVINVYVGSEPLVDFGHSRGLTTETITEDGLERVSVRFADNNGTVIMSDGRLAATLEARDTYVVDQLNQLDTLAQAIIYEVNRVHSQGCGLVAYESQTSTFAMADVTVALDTTDAGLTYPVQNGTFQVRIRDKFTGQVTTKMIEVDLDGLNGDDTTLTALAVDLNAVPGLSATITSGQKLKLDVTDGYEFSFAEDTSGVLAALGLGNFFEGTNATTMDVRSDIRNNPQLIATSLSGAQGDGSNAGDLAAVGTTASDLLGSLSITDYQEAITNRLAIDTAAAETEYIAADAVYSSLTAQRQSISGVDLDEEAINLTMYERAFEGASRFLTVVNTLTAELLTLVE